MDTGPDVKEVCGVDVVGFIALAADAILGVDMDVVVVVSAKAPKPMNSPLWPLSRRPLRFSFTMI